jgi:hypothetical protein
MAHFAKMNGNIVEQVIVIANDDCDNLPFPESEPVGQAFIASLGLSGNWLQTSYSASFRSLYAGIGDIFRSDLGEYGEFVGPPLTTPEA